MRTLAKALFAGGVALATAGAALAEDNPMVGGAAMFAERNIVENPVNSADHTTLVAAVQAAGLVETLLKPENKDGKVTLTDETGGSATVTIADVVQSNGVIHVIDKVLLPAG